MYMPVNYELIPCICIAGASQQFIENGFANEFLSRIKENQDNPKTLATLVFILSDLIDIDSSGALAKYSTNNGILNLLFNLLRQKGTSLGSSSSSNDSPMSALGIKAAAFCCISAISFYCTGMQIIWCYNASVEFTIHLDCRISAYMYG